MELVYLQWIDSDASSTWQWRSTWRNRITRAHTIGWLVNEDDETITVSSTIFPSESDGDVQLMGYVTIPKVALTLRLPLPQVLGREP